MDLLSQSPLCDAPRTAKAPSPAAGTGDGRTSHGRGPLRPLALASSRRRLRGELVARRFRQVDAIIAAAAFAAGVGIWRPDWASASLREVLPKAMFAALVLFLLRSTAVYSFKTSRPPALHLAVVLACCGAATFAGVGLGVLAQISIPPLLAWSAAASGALCAAHLLAQGLVAFWRRTGRLTPTVVVVGATTGAERLIEAALSMRDTAVLGVFDDRGSRIPQNIQGVPVLGTTHALLTHRLLPYIDHIVITVTPSAQGRVRELIDRLKYLPNTVTLFMDLEGVDGQRRTLSRLADAPLTQVSGPRNESVERSTKRLQDLVIGFLALVLSAPVMLLIAAAILAEGRGPVFFRQTRHGFNNEPIEVWKFRSLRADAEDQAASRQIQPHDPRVTRVGRVIRSLSLDELPQLFNVFRGEMSLVGPRPHAVGMRTAGAESARLVAEYAWRHRMKPGMTGWAQIHGSIGPIDTPELVRRRVALDIEYIERHSLWLDLYILMMTAPALIRARKVAR